MAKRVNWSGVFPAVTTQFFADQSLNLEGTKEHVARLIQAGVNGLIMLGTLGEITSLDLDEKKAVLTSAQSVVKGRVPVLSGVCESSTRAACRYAEEITELGVDGFMFLPPMPYHADTKEAIQHARLIARSTPLPIMVYNNPIHYGVDMTPEAFAALADESNIVAIKESSGISSRITDLINRCGDRFVLFAGVDEVVLESALLGATGYVCGAVNAFPKETVHLWKLAQAGRWNDARQFYRWFTPVLELDRGSKVVQKVKLAQALAGSGAEYVRMPRAPMEGLERAEVERVVKQALAARPGLLAA